MLILHKWGARILLKWMDMKIYLPSSRNMKEFLAAEKVDKIKASTGCAKLFRFINTFQRLIFSYP